MSITITDVARQAGVSKSTVSRYLNGRYDSMGSETKERIARVIAELEYRPNALARSLKQKRTHTVGAIVANILNPFSTSIIRGIEDQCKKSGFNLILCNADDDPVKEREYIEMLTSKQIDGLIINTTGCNNGLVQEVNQSLPVVLIDRKVPEINIDTVTVDSSFGVRLAIGYLVDLGYRDIALFTLPCDHVSPRMERVQGYRAALQECGLPVREDFLVQTEIEPDALAAKLKELLDKNNGESGSLAIFGANNLMTMAVVKTLKKMGVAVPGKVAIIGFDDWEWAELIDPPITVVAQPTYDMGVKAASLLIKRIAAQKPVKKPSLIVYRPQLVARKSCGE